MEVVEYRGIRFLLGLTGDLIGLETKSGVSDEVGRNERLRMLARSIKSASLMPLYNVFCFITVSSRGMPGV